MHATDAADAVQQAAEQGLRIARIRYPGLAGDSAFIREQATEIAMQRLPDAAWTGDEDQWDEMAGIIERLNTSE